VLFYSQYVLATFLIYSCACLHAPT